MNGTAKASGSTAGEGAGASAGCELRRRDCGEAVSNDDERGRVGEADRRRRVVRPKRVPPRQQAEAGAIPYCGAASRPQVWGYGGGHRRGPPRLDLNPVRVPERREGRLKWTVMICCEPPIWRTPWE